MVRRRRRSDGGAFWGCSTYPRCRGICDVESARPNAVVGEAPPVLAAAARAGGSARAELDRRTVRQGARVRRRGPWIVPRRRPRPVFGGSALTLTYLIML